MQTRQSQRTMFASVAGKRGRMYSVAVLAILAISGLHWKTAWAAESCTLTTLIDWAREPVKFQEVQLSEAMPEAAEPATYNRPQTLFVGDDGTIYVPDPVNQRILVFKSNGQFSKSIALDHVPGSDKAYAYIIPIMKVDGSGNIYIVNEGAKDIEIYSASGVLKRRISYPGRPVYFLDIGKDGLIYIFGVDYRSPLEVLDQEGRLRGDKMANYHPKDMQSYSSYDVEPIEKMGHTTFRLRRDGRVVSECATKYLMSEQTGSFVNKNGDFYFFKFNTDYKKNMNIVRVRFVKK